MGCSPCFSMCFSEGFSFFFFFSFFFLFHVSTLLFLSKDDVATQPNHKEQLLNDDDLFYDGELLVGPISVSYLSFFLAAFLFQCVFFYFFYVHSMFSVHSSPFPKSFLLRPYRLFRHSLFLLRRDEWLQCPQLRIRASD